MKKALGENKNIYIRFAEPSDLKDLFRWRNDKATRKASFDTDEITIEQHTKWFKKSLTNINRNIFIICDKHCNKLGQIRFDKKIDTAEIDITINPKYRNQGIGALSIFKSSNIYVNNFDIKKIIAKVKKNNTKSLKAFEKADFRVYREYDDYIELWYENGR